MNRPDPLTREDIESGILAAFLAILLSVALYRLDFAAIVLCLGVFIALAYSVEVPK